MAKKSLDLAAIKARLSKITEGEWTTDEDTSRFGCVKNVNCDDGVVAKMNARKPLDVSSAGVSLDKRMALYFAQCNANADFVAHAPKDVAALVAEVERLRSKLKKTEES